MQDGQVENRGMRSKHESRISNRPIDDSRPTDVRGIGDYSARSQKLSWYCVIRSASLGLHHFHLVAHARTHTFPLNSYISVVSIVTLINTLDGTSILVTVVYMRASSFTLPLNSCISVLSVVALINTLDGTSILVTVSRRKVGNTTACLD